MLYPPTGPPGSSRFPILLPALFAVLSATAERAPAAPTPADAGPVVGFVENRGQAAGPARYYAPGSAATAWFTTGGVVVDRREILPESADVPADDRLAARVRRSAASATHTARGRVVHITFEGAQPSPVIEPAGELPTRLNWLRGRDPSRWLAGLPVHASLVYREVWPGVDLVFRVENGFLAYEARVRPGGSADAVRFRVEGAADPTVGDAAGWPLAVAAPEPIPPAPQPLASPLVWSTYLGGSLGEYASAVALGAGDLVLLAGQTRSTDFPTTVGAYDRQPAGSYDAFVAQLDAFGRRIVWCTFLGGTAEDLAYSVALDGAGHVIVGGHTESPDFPVTAGALDTSFGGGGDGFVVRLDMLGSSLRAATLVGGSGHDVVADIAVDASGAIVATGNTASADFPLAGTGFDRTYGGGHTDGFLLRLGADLRSLAWSTYLGGQYNDYGEALAIDADGSIVVAGNTGSPDFPVTAGSLDRTANGGDDAFVVRFAAGGGAPRWSTFIGGSGFDACTDFVLDLAGNALIAGTTYSTDFPTTVGAWDRSFNGGHDVFVSRLSADGTLLLMSTLLGGGGGETAWALAVDPLFGAFVLGETGSPDFPVTSGAFDRSYGGGATDCFLARVGPSGRDLSWSTFIGGSGDESGYALARSATGDLVAAGGTGSLDFPVTAVTWDRSLAGQVEAFAMRLAQPRPVAVAEGAPRAGTLLQSWPNPCNAQAVVAFRLDEQAEVLLTLHDLRGRPVRTLAQGPRGDGEHRVVWDGRDDAGRAVASGVYRCRLRVANSLQESRIVVAK